MPNLLPGEAVLRSGPAVWVGPPMERAGGLTVTNQAIVFEAEGGGGPMMARPGRPMFGGPPRRRPGWGPRGGGGGRPGFPGELRIPLWRCRSAAATQGPRGPVLEIELLSRRIALATPDAAAFATAITAARANAPPPPPGFGPGGGGAAVDRSQMPKCDYCGHLSPVAATRCETCGAPLGPGGA
ncbi:MAG TPA: hypothetical protein VMH78_01350 [Thermoplasmata archaeon]|nr:hypothetical protein [Thermoplasmata archaeon]